MARSDNGDDEAEFALRHEDQREEEISDHHARHPQHLHDYGKHAHSYDEDVGYPVSTTLDQVYALEHGHRGHGLGKHVGRSDEELKSFPSYESDGASTFETPRQMDSAIRAVFDQRAGEIEQWLAVDPARDAADVERWVGDDAERRTELRAWKEGAGKDFADEDATAKKEFDLDLGDTVGRWAKAGMESSVDVSGARVVLARDDDAPEGFDVRTAFPVPAEQIADDSRPEQDGGESAREGEDEDTVEGWGVRDRSDVEADGYGESDDGWGAEGDADEGDASDGDYGAGR